MANKIYIEYKELSLAGNALNISGKGSLELPLISDVTIETRSEWSSLGDFMPNFIQDILYYFYL